MCDSSIIDQDKQLIATACGGGLSNDRSIEIWLVILKSRPSLLDIILVPYRIVSYCILSFRIVLYGFVSLGYGPPITCTVNRFVRYLRTVDVILPLRESCSREPTARCRKSLALILDDPYLISVEERAICLAGVCCDDLF